MTARIPFNSDKLTDFCRRWADANMVSQEEWQLTRKLRAVMAAVLFMVAGAMLAISLRYSGGRVQLEDLVAPAMFLALALLLLLARTPRVCALGNAVVLIAVVVVNWVVGRYTWRHIADDWIGTGIVILVILLIFRIKRGREHRASSS